MCASVHNADPWRCMCVIPFEIRLHDNVKYFSSSVELPCTSLRLAVRLSLCWSMLCTHGLRVWLSSLLLCLFWRLSLVKGNLQAHTNDVFAESAASFESKDQYFDGNHGRAGTSVDGSIKDYLRSWSHLRSWTHLRILDTSEILDTSQDTSHT